MSLITLQSEWAERITIRPACIFFNIATPGLLRKPPTETHCNPKWKESLKKKKKKTKVLFCTRENILSAKQIIWTDL